MGAQLGCNSLGKGRCRCTRTGLQYGSQQQESDEIQRYHWSPRDSNMNHVSLLSSSRMRQPTQHIISSFLRRQPLTRHRQGLSWGSRKNRRRWTNRKQNQAEPHFTLNYGVKYPLNPKAHNVSKKGPLIPSDSGGDWKHRKLKNCVEVGAKKGEEIASERQEIPMLLPKPPQIWAFQITSFNPLLFH